MRPTAAAGRRADSTAAATTLAMSDYEFTMSLRIRHPTAEPAEITRILGIEPQHMWRVGEARRDAVGREIGAGDTVRAIGWADS